MFEDEMRAAIEALLRRKPNATQADMQAVLDRLQSTYNDRPQADLHGLSPNQAHALLSERWDGKGPIRWATDLPLEVVEGTPWGNNARLLLEHVAEAGRVKMTTSGNLPRNSVASLVPRVRWSEDMDPEIFRDRIRKEQDGWTLHVTRITLEEAGLLKRRHGVMTLTKRGEEMRRDDRGGALFGLLFQTMFGRMNLEYVAQMGVDAPGFQAAIAATLYLYGRTEPRWELGHDVASRVLLPFVRDAVRSRFGGSDSTGAVTERRFLHVLEGFGLVEFRQTPPGRLGIREEEFRRTPLFDRFLRFEV